MHTDGYFCDIFYTNGKHKYNFVNNHLVRFIAHRDFKRTASKVYSTQWMKYRFLAQTNKRALSDEAIEKARININRKNIVDPTYNEFEL